MPSIEIVCVGQCEPTDFWYLPFAVEAETTLVSHRSPTPLFQADFDRLKGCLYHLGGACLRYPPMRERSTFTASDLCEEWGGFIRFKPRYMIWVDKLLSALLDASPEQRVLFTSDYQFGPEARRFKRPLTLDTFWRRHDEGRLRTNAAFTLTKN